MTGRQYLQYDWQEAMDRHDSRIVNMADVEPRPVRWLWRGFIPRGMVTLLFGAAGLGKSQLALCIAAAASQGKFLTDEERAAWPDPSTSPFESVLLCSAEDPIHEVVAPRLGANEAELRYIESLRVETWLPDGLTALQEDLKRVEYGLVVIDPLMSYIDPSADTNNAHDMRSGVMRGLAFLAEASNAAVLCVMHPKKGEEREMYQLISGSAAFGEAARSVLAVGDLDGNRRVVGRVKGNLDMPPAPVGFTIESATYRGVPTSRVVTGGSMPDVDMEDVLLRRGKPGPKADPGIDADCIAFIRTELADGDVLSTVVERHAKSNGLSFARVKALKKLAGTRSVKRGAEWYWTMAEGATDDAADD